MYRTILVALDGSHLAERALPYAKSLAQSSGARIHLVRVVVPETLAGLGPLDDQTKELRQAEAYLRTVTARLEANVPVDAAVIYGDPATSILDEARSKQADLIVMSTHGRSGFGRWIYGSVADAVIRRAETPVFLVPSGGDQYWPENRPRRVLVSLDGSDLATEAIEPACQLARTIDAELLLVRIVVPPTYAFVGAHPYAYEGAAPYDLFDVEAELAEAERYLANVAASLRSRGLSVQIHVESGNPVGQIATIAQEHGANVIAMATHGAGGLTRLVIGSVATGTLQRTSVPVLLVRPSTVRRLEAIATAGGTSTVESHPVSLSLTARECEVVALGLRELLSHPGPGESCIDEIRSLLARLEQMSPVTEA